jgi:hypothetical protein
MPMPMKIRKGKEGVNEALNQLMAALSLEGESGTEALFLILEAAVAKVDWSVVERRRQDGYGIDVNWLLTNAIIEAAA